VRVRGVLHVITVAAATVGLVVGLASRGSSTGTTTRTVRSEASGPTRRAQSTAPPAPTTTVAPPTIPATTAPVLPSTTAPPLADSVVPTTASAPPPALEPATHSIPQTLVAHLTQPMVQVYAHPSDPRSSAALSSSTEFGNVRALPVVARAPDWLEVQLPLRPNGSSGWIRARDAQLGYIYDEIIVDLTARTLVWSRSGAVMLTTTVGIGAHSSPTPTGSFFLTDVLPRDPAGSYGAWILALDGHSEAFTEFEGGDARIAIHGTDDPSSIGSSVSSGCVRVASGPLVTLAASLPLGTPVVIR